MLAAIAAHVETLPLAAAPTKQTNASDTTADFNRAAGGRHEHDNRPSDGNYNSLEYIEPKEWMDYASRMFAECLPPTGT
jgi:hypothetical protein